MQFLRLASWDEEVLPTWLATFPKIKNINYDIRAQLPPDMQWYLATINKADIVQLRLIGSTDFRRAFGSYQIDAACQRIKLNDAVLGSDNVSKNHIHRVHDLVDFFQAGNASEPLIMVGAQQLGPFTFIDGNHRAMALHLCSRLVGQLVYVGIAEAIATDFMLFVLSGTA